MEQNETTQQATENQKNESVKSPLNFLGQLGGYRPGAGRPKGSKNKRTREREAIEKEFQGRVLKKVDRLFNAKMHVAEGLTHMFKLVQRKGRPDEHVLITDPDEIKMVLDELKGRGGEVDGQYYFITTRDPDSRAIEDLLNRGLGPVQKKLDLTSKDKQIAQPLLYVLNHESTRENTRTKQEN